MTADPTAAEKVAADPVRSDFICSGCVGDGTRLVPVADVEKPGTIGGTDLARLWVEVES